jgi:hypothetical protein
MFTNSSGKRSEGNSCGQFSISGSKGGTRRQKSKKEEQLSKEKKKI